MSHPAHGEQALAYARGRFVAEDEAVIPVEDRAHQFGDGIYEVVRVYEGHPHLLDYHLERFEKSAAAIRLRLDRSMPELRSLIREAIDRAGFPEAQVYFQLSRGIVRRDHPFPDVPSHLSMTVRPVADEKYARIRQSGQRVILAEDIRWKYCYIKSLNLLPNVLVKQQALDAGVNDALFVAEGVVREATSSNISIVRGGALVTHPANERILHGVTRRTVLELCALLGIPAREETFTVADLLAADEVFTMSTLTELAPIVEVDGQAVGPRALEEGSVLRRLQRAYRERVAREVRQSRLAAAP